MPWQFAGFYRDYFEGYPARSYSWLEYNIRGGLEDLIARQSDPPAPIYIANNIAWVDYYWPFYLVKYDRTSLRAHTSFIDVSSDPALEQAPAGSLVLCLAAAEPRLVRLGFRPVRAIAEPDGLHSFSVLQR